MKSRFSIPKGQVAEDAIKQQARGSTYGHLALPRGTNVFKEEPNSRAHLDFLTYIVTDPKHPDRDDKRGQALPNAPWYRRPYRLHRNVGVSNESMVCPTSIGKKCPICEHRTKRNKEEADKEELRELRASQRNLYIVVPKDSKDYEDKPYIWDISQYLFQDMLNAELKEDPDSRESFTDPNEGLTLKIRFGENQIGKNKFAETSRIDFESRDYAYSDSLLEKLPNLDECLIIMSYDELHAKFFGLEEGDGETVKVSQVGDDTPDIKPKRAVIEPKPQRGTQDKGADDDESVTSRIQRKSKPESPFEEDEKPRRPKTIIYDDEEDDDDEEEGAVSGPMRHRAKPKDEEEEESRPIRKSKPVQSDLPLKSKSNGKCPAGHEFGKDCEKFDEDCGECQIWEACYEAKGKLHRGQK